MHYDTIWWTIHQKGHLYIRIEKNYLFILFFKKTFTHSTMCGIINIESEVSKLEFSIKLRKIKITFGIQVLRTKKTKKVIKSWR